MNANNNTKTFTITTMDGKSTTVKLEDNKPSLWQGINLQAEMLMYDLLHGTNYRRIRNHLVREKRNREFELRIGIAKVK